MVSEVTRTGINVLRTSPPPTFSAFLYGLFIVPGTNKVKFRFRNDFFVAATQLIRIVLFLLTGTAI